MIFISLSILITESPKNENATPKAEVLQDNTEAKETIEGGGSISETNGGDSTAKDDSQLDENGGETIFSYERLKAKSTNPATGIDYMRREVCTLLYIFICIIPSKEW